MDATATDAKNRLAQRLEACQREPVIIEPSGRRHSLPDRVSAMAPWDLHPKPQEAGTLPTRAWGPPHACLRDPSHRIVDALAAVVSGI